MAGTLLPSSFFTHKLTHLAARTQLRLPGAAHHLHTDSPRETTTDRTPMQIDSIDIDIKSQNRIMSKSTESSSAHTPKQSTLLMMPHEIRDKIYAAFMRTRYSPPKDTRDANSRCRLGGVHYPRNLGGLSALSQCSRQIRKELKRLSTTQGFAKAAVNELDVMIDSSDAYPTWTILLHPEIRRMEHLRVNLQIMNLVRGHGGPFWASEELGKAYH